MADIYVRSTDGNDADNGSTWALAKATLAGASGIDAAGDTIWVSQNHAESSASAQTIALAGTSSNPVRVLCGTDSAEPPTALNNTAVVATTGANNIQISNSGYFYGITFSAGSSSSAAKIWVWGDGHTQVYELCKLITANSNNQALLIGHNGVVSHEFTSIFKNCTFKFGAASQGLFVAKSKVLIDGGGIDSGGTSLTNFISSALDAIEVKVKNFDFSNFGSTFNLVVGSLSASGRIDFVGCKLPASWSGGVCASAPAVTGLRVSMYNCDSGATNYRLWIETFSGSIKSETTLVKTGGASDGTTPISWKMVANANANELVAPLVSDDFSVWLDSTGTSKTITVDILHDSATALTDAEVWLEVDYLGNSSYPIGTPASDKRATVLTTSASQTTSTATWTTTGMTNPNKQKLEVTFTPQMKGFVTARVCLAKPSYTVYVDPKATVA